MNIRQLARDSHDYQHAAWFAYWQWVQRLIDEEQCKTTMEARKIIHAQGNPPKPEPEEGHSFATTDEYLVAFMGQFEEWQDGDYSREQHRAKDSEWEFGDFEIDWARIGKIKTTSLDEFFIFLSWSRRENLISHLHGCNRWDHIKSLVDDPIYGEEAKFELQSDEWSKSFQADEVFRYSQLPEVAQEMLQIVKHGSPSNYSVHYPWVYPPEGFDIESLPDGQQKDYMRSVEQVPNCLCVMADGGPLFKIEVLDPNDFTRHRLAVLRDPWWSINGGIGETPEPWAGEYDFDFPQFGIEVGNEFGTEQLLEVLQAGVERINTRGDRKFGATQ